MKDNEIVKSANKTLELLAFTMGIVMASNMKYDYFDMLLDDKLMGYSISLVSEIDAFLDEGYSYQEIAKIIEENDYKKAAPELSEDDIRILKFEALRILKIRYKLYLESKQKVEPKMKKKTYDF